MQALQLSWLNGLRREAARFPPYLAWSDAAPGPPATFPLSKASFFFCPHVAVNRTVPGGATVQPFLWVP